MIKKELPDDWPAPNEHLLELGRISALWGSLENSVNLAISKFAGYQAIYDFRAAIMTAHANFKQRVDMLGALCDQLKDDCPHLQSHEKVISLIINAQTKRNKYMHNGIYYNEETKRVEIATLTARGKLKTTIDAVTVADLQEVSATIHEAMCALHNLLTQKEIKPIWKRNA
jgi:hypothetical protein